MTTNNMSRNSFSAGNRTNIKIQSSRDDILNSRYNLTEPQGVYPLDSFPSSSSTTTTTTTADIHGQPHKYPDFLPWKHSPKEDVLAINHLQKGYYESPHVANELLSARNIMHQLLRSTNSLDELSSNLLEAIDMRSNNNKIGSSSYKPPPRVTLTDQKRESWLKDLASSDVPLRKLSRTIPHGVRNKSLLDQCVSKHIPINRAIWFVRCVGTNELRGLKRKGGANMEFNWIQEWTLQVVEYIEKLSLEYQKFESPHHQHQQASPAHNNEEMIIVWKAKLSYIIRFVGNLYIESLIDKECFKNWINRFFKNCKNFEIPLTLTLIKLFWSDLMKTDYLIKELTESLLLKYQQLSNVKSVLDSKDLTVSDWKLNEKIKSRLLTSFKALILESFNQSIDNFILPNTWNQLKPIIKSILNLDNVDSATSKNFNLISYRNESLMINYSLNKNDHNESNLVQLLDDNSSIFYDFKKIIDAIFTDAWKPSLEILIHWGITKYRHGSHRIYVISELLKRSKNQQSLVTNKDIEQELLNIIFNLQNHIEDINFQDLYYLLNELTHSKTFKTTVYVRRLISSGLMYLSNNDDEKFLHSSILKNLKPSGGNNSQSLLVLKNLNPSSNDENLKAINEENLKIGRQLLESILEAGIYNADSFQFFHSLYIGQKLKLSETLVKLIGNSSSLAQSNYSSLQTITQLFVIFRDYRNLVQTYIALLEHDVLNLEQLEFIAEFFITNDNLIALFTNFDQLTELFIKTFNKLDDKCIELNKFWTFASKNVQDDRLQFELKQIIIKKEIQINNQAVQENLTRSKANISLEDFLDYNNFHNNFQTLIRSLFNNSNNDVTERSGIIKLLIILKNYNVAEINKILFVYIKKTYSSTTDLFRHEPLLDLVVSELINLNVIVDTFLSFQSPIYLSFIKDLLFRDMSDVEGFDHLKLSLLREQFKRHYPDVLLLIIKDSLMDSATDSKSENIHSDSADIMNSFLPEQRSNQYKPEFLKIFIENLVHRQSSIIKVFNIDDNESKQKFLSVLNDAVCSEGISSTPLSLNNDLSNLVQLIEHLNEFNLPIFQLLFKLKLDEIASDSQFIEFFSSIVKNTHKGGEKFIGSLFDLVDDKLKISFIHYLESLFLKSKSFPHIQVGGTEMKLTFISDILINLSQSLEKVKLPDELVFSLDNSLESLLNIVNKSERSTELYDAIALFLRIIIIHKAFIIDIIVDRNSIKETFLNNLVNILTSKVISQNLQLKNLLYDLLLSIKSAVNEMNSNQTSNVKLPLSLMNLPTISQNSSSIQSSYYEDRSNLHDDSIIRYLYIYNKTSQGYSEMNAKAFDLVEDSNPTEALNDTAINLQLFDTTIERKNPT